MLPPDGWRLGAGLYSPASNKTRALAVRVRRCEGSGERATKPRTATLAFFLLDGIRLRSAHSLPFLL
jgi:hypothetical protein